MNKVVLMLTAGAAALSLSACADSYYGPPPGPVGPIVGPVAYDGYYDGAYGAFYDGYWDNDGAFYYTDAADHPYRRDDAHHFRHDNAEGFHGVSSVGAHHVGGGEHRPG